MFSKNLYLVVYFIILTSYKILDRLQWGRRLQLWTSNKKGMNITSKVNMRWLLPCTKSTWPKITSITKMHTTTWHFASINSISTINALSAANKHSELIPIIWKSTLDWLWHSINLAIIHKPSQMPSSSFKEAMKSVHQIMWKWRSYVPKYAIKLCIQFPFKFKRKIKYSFPRYKIKTIKNKIKTHNIFQVTPGWMSRTVLMMVTPN